MSESNRTNEDENCTENKASCTSEGENCTENEASCTKTEVVQSAKSLKEKVFLVCNKIENSGTPITRALVRKETGGSDRDVSRYIAEWRESLVSANVPESVPNHAGNNQSLAVREEGEINASPEAQKPEYPNTQQSKYSNTPSSDLEAIARRGAERAAALMIGEDAVMYHLLENPDRLPEDLRQQVEAYQGINSQRSQRRQEQYKPDFFVEAAIAQFS
jgi:hypothetical protein